MFNKLLGAAAAITLSTVSAFAQSSAFSTDAGSFSTDGFYTYGYIDLSYLDDGSSSQEFLTADVDFGILPGSGLSSGPWGFMVGIDAISDFTFHEEVFYYSVLYGFGSHLFAIGNPRSVLDRGYLPDRNFAYNNFFGYQLSGYTNSYLAALLIGIDETAYGARYDGEFGSTKVGLSYHHLDLSGGANVLGLALRHEFAAISSFLAFAGYFGLEHFDVSGSSETLYHVGVEGSTDRLTAGLSYNRLDLFGNTRATELYLDYKVLDNLELTTSYLNIDAGGGSQDAYGLGARYMFPAGFYGDISFVDLGSSAEFWEISLGFQF